MSTIDKTVTKIQWNKEAKRYMQHVKVMTFNYDSYQQKRMGVNPIHTKTEWLELPACLKKEVTVPIILKKTATNYDTFETIQAYFSATLKVRVIAEDTYRDQYLSVDNNRVFLHNVSSGQTCPIALGGTNQIGTIREWLKDEKKLSEDEALALMDSNVAVYEKIGNSEIRMLI